MNTFIHQNCSKKKIPTNISMGIGHGRWYAFIIKSQLLRYSAVLFLVLPNIFNYMCCPRQCLDFYFWFVFHTCTSSTNRRVVILEDIVFCGQCRARSATTGHKLFSNVFVLACIYTATKTARELGDAGVGGVNGVRTENSEWLSV